MKPRVTDPFPREIEIRRGRRRTIELALEGGRFVARVPMRAQGERLEQTLSRLRESLWTKLQRDSVYDDAGLDRRARVVQRRWFAAVNLPPYRVRFSRRQHKRWGSCTFDGREGSIRLSAHLMGHPVWLIDAVLQHEMAHLLEPNHGERFQALVCDNPDHDRARGYLEALETVDRLGVMAVQRLVAALPEEDEGGGDEQPGLFDTAAS